ncbi:DUF3035 domain-containing protein [Phaeovulum sp. W22_SRMD_FR3]|uniref:DUF3035 domain-containing protein n=1 Tax=Phaeovulum sp. W22_SRMD_FR3 TaxID=3240274 RepID=UPI003F95C985
MRATFGIHGTLCAALLALTACGGGDKVPKLMFLHSSGSGPDEFSILPTKPLQMPPDLAALPEPTPGGSNITDPTPVADAVAALGGKPELLSRPGIPAGDSALVARAGRFGQDGDIRTTLAAEDLDWRREHNGRFLERLLKVNVYYSAYKPMSLDQHIELERWRLAGVPTVSAPPDPELVLK